MCGTPRPSTGNRKAIIFPTSPSSTTSPTSYSLSFRDADADADADQMNTKAIFGINDSPTLRAFQACQGIDVRIETHGDLTAPLSSTKPPLHQFRLGGPGLKAKAQAGWEFELPERLDLGVSERGIVGRKVTVCLEGAGGEKMGMGIVGYD